MKTPTVFCRCLALAVLCTVSFSAARAQYVPIPDTAFAHFLRVEYPACMNGNLMDTTCADIVADETVNCAARNIKDLTGIQYFDALEHLTCDHNQITFIPDLTNTAIDYLYCIHNDLTSLPAFPQTLTWLSCSYNQIDSLPDFAPNFYFLACGYNPLGSLPDFTNTRLRTLYCDSCHLTALPTLPSTLVELFCSYNPLYTLPAIPASVTRLGCRKNRLTTLPALPNGVYDLDCSDNPSLEITTLPSG